MGPAHCPTPPVRREQCGRKQDAHPPAPTPADPGQPLAVQALAAAGGMRPRSVHCQDRAGQRWPAWGTGSQLATSVLKTEQNHHN